MAFIIAGLTAVFIILLIIAVKAKNNFPVFTDEQLLNQHRRFLMEMESSRHYLSTIYLQAKVRGSPAEQELTRRGYDVKKLLAEQLAAERANRPMNWKACLLPKTTPPGS